MREDWCWSSQGREADEELRFMCWHGMRSQRMLCLFRYEFEFSEIIEELW